ncbi:3-hydroxyacyl-ACP dehydratase FabZ [Desulfofustis limnaeus]|jgi:3-hydroxyacyl-[acyl-carrier-protein] dehydratase|uniref:Beta-hydroxyacyl-ACP dehydratase n=1 Tax=Desulfofustis limnaeus TaxID=2740163 RepID=A0ABN6M746_9BACT|nr:3-hydroxyacyl-ACP dehydratase FabZ [Desulfofustis limnaeus]MDX9894374.1 3-hydroxyacyl-ACP dehydratase FabZ [Desulfofustis sp.]BDD87257.1 hypothetical protein DPPLL_16220 [Desulfofustis limnaeus]
MDKRISSLIPHRPPFLWVDKIIATTVNSITAEKRIPDDLEVFSGHYPGRPLLPGVLLCEAIFQTGALLIATILEKKSEDNAYQQKIPVLTKITGAKFKRQVLPGDTVQMTVDLIETVASVCFCKGIARVNGKVALKTEFSCALVAP